MTNVLIVYATDWGSTRKAAEAVAKGVESVPGARAKLVEAEKATPEDLTAADAILLGSPVHMGSLDWRMKTFIDKVCSGLWMKDTLVGKVGAVFATGGGYGNAGGGVELTLLSMLTNLAELGMLIVPLPKNTPGYARGGLQWGAYARSMGENMEQTGVADSSLEAARHHGANVARVAQVVAGKKLFAG